MSELQKEGTACLREEDRVGKKKGRGVGPLTLGEIPRKSGGRGKGVYRLEYKGANKTRGRREKVTQKKKYPRLRSVYQREKVTVKRNNLEKEYG